MSPGKLSTLTAAWPWFDYCITTFKCSFSLLVIDKKVCYLNFSRAAIALVVMMLGANCLSWERGFGS